MTAIPSDQTSTLLPYPSSVAATTSGAIQWGVPIVVWRRVIVEHWSATPKSAIFTTPAHPERGVRPTQSLGR